MAEKEADSYFGDDVIITEGNGTSIITFKENAYSIFKRAGKQRRCLIIDMAAAIWWQQS